jgi:hypothetical protein
MLRLSIIISWTSSQSSIIRRCNAFIPKRTLQQWPDSRSVSISNSIARLSTDAEAESSSIPPLYLAEGVFAVVKPLGWSSQQIVGKIRKILEADAKERGAPDHRKKRRKPWMKVGHGGTLDPLVCMYACMYVLCMYEYSIATFSKRMNRPCGFACVPYLSP